MHKYELWYCGSCVSCISESEYEFESEEDNKLKSCKEVINNV